MKFASLLAAVAFLVAPSAFAQVPAAASKGLPMWVIRDADSTIYITGTIHALPDQTSWRSERLDAALKEASELWLELAEIGHPDGPYVTLLPIIEEMARNEDGPILPNLLSEEEYTQLREVLEETELPREALDKIDTLKPWYAMFALSRTPFINSAYETGNGIDIMLAQLANGHGHTIKGLETIQDQVGDLAEAPLDLQVEEIRSMLATTPAEKAQVVRLQDLVFGAWTRGDINMVEAMITLVTWGNREFADELLKDRNENWAGQIEEMLKGAGVTFIAVGAGHLVGPDSLQQRLKLRGIETKIY